MSALFNVSQSRHSIHDAASKVYTRYPSLKEKEKQLEEFREQLQKRVHELASSRLEAQEALQKENRGYIQKKQSFRQAVTDVTLMEEILGNLDRGFEGLQPVPEKDPKSSEIEKTNKIEQAKTTISLQKLAFFQLKRRMKTSLADVILLMKQFNAIVSGQGRQKSNEHVDDSSCPSTPIVEKRGVYSTSTEWISSSSSSCFSSPAFASNERVFSDISENNRGLALQEYRQPYPVLDEEDDETPRSELNPEPFDDGSTLSTQITYSLNSIHGHLDDMSKIDEEGIKRIRAYISAPLDGEKPQPTGKINSKTRTPPVPAQTAKRPSDTFPPPETPTRPQTPSSEISSDEADPPRPFLGDSGGKKTDRSSEGGCFDWLCCSGTRGKFQAVQDLDNHGIKCNKKKE